MAIFEFKCTDCGVTSEILMLTSDDKPKCEKCGSENLEKQLSGFAVSSKSSSGGAPSCDFGGKCGGCPGRR